MPAGQRGTGTLQYGNIRYPGMAAYDAALVIVVRQHGAAFRELAAALERQGLMTPQEAATAAPTLRVQVLDERENKSDPLSVPQWMGAKVIYESNEREPKQTPPRCTATLRRGFPADEALLVWPSRENANGLRWRIRNVSVYASLAYVCSATAAGRVN